MKQCAIFMPAYNCEKTIRSVIERFPQDAWPKIEAVYVVSHGSRDKVTEEVTKLSSENPKIHLVTNHENLGYGSVVRDGLKHCMTTDAEYFVCVHGDGQYPPERIPEFLDHMDANGIDVLQGSRHKENTALKGGMPLYKYVAGKILTWMENRCFNIRMSDYHSGFMFYRRRAVKVIPTERLSNYFDFDLEFIAASCAAGLKVDELAIQAFYGEEQSNLNPIIYGFHCLKVMYKYVTRVYHDMLDTDNTAVDRAVL